MVARRLLSLLICALGFGVAERAEAYNSIVVPPGKSVKVKTPLSKGAVWVRSGRAWRKLAPVADGRQRILRRLHASGHQIMKGKHREWLTIKKSGTATVRLIAHADAAGAGYTIRVACDVEDMLRGAKKGTLYRDARIEIKVVVDMPKFLPDFFLGSGDQVTLPIPPTIHVRRVTSGRPKVATAEMQGAQLSLKGKTPGKAKVTLNYWISDEVKERFSRVLTVEVAVPPLEYVCSLEPGASKRVTFDEIGKALRKQLPASEGVMKQIVRWEGQPQAGIRIEAGALAVVAQRTKSRSTAVIPFLGFKRKRPFEAWIRFTVDTGGDALASGSTKKPRDAKPNPTPKEDTEPKEEPAEPLRVVNQFGSAIGQDYQARTKIENLSSKTVEVEVTIRFKGASGQEFGVEIAQGPKTLAPGKKGRYKATLANAGPVVASFEVVLKVLGTK